MPKMLKSARTLADLTVRELARLRILNEKLWQSEHWIRECTIRTLFAVEMADAASADTAEILAGVSRQQPAMTVRILCVGQVSRGDFGLHYDDVIAILSAADLLEGNKRCGQLQMTVADEYALLGRNPSSLFNMLLSQLNGDWLRMLDVQTLKFEIAVTATRSLYVSASSLEQELTNKLRAVVQRDGS